MACVAVHAREAGDPDGAADRPEPLGLHAAIGFTAGIAPDPGRRGGPRVELVRGERIGAGLGLRADSDRRKSSSKRQSGLGTVRTRLLTAADGPWSLQRTGGRPSAGVVQWF